MTHIGLAPALLALCSVVPAADAPAREGPTGIPSPLPERLDLDAQEWPFQPGPRRVAVFTASPPAGITPNTGLMLCLHNWGGRFDAPDYVAWCGLSPRATTSSP